MGSSMEVHEKAHISAHRVAVEVRKDYRIDKVSETCARGVAQCVPCILPSQKAGKQEGLLHPIDKGDTLLDTYHVDHLGPLPSTVKSYKYLLVVVDAFTKFVFLHTIKATSSAAALKKLKLQKEMFGSPRRIVSDRGTAFTSNEFKENCERHGIEHVLIATGVPRGNGQAERIIGIVIPEERIMSRKAVKKDIEQI